jgi:hypothetical protein
MSVSDELRYCQRQGRDGEDTLLRLGTYRFRGRWRNCRPKLLQMTELVKRRCLRDRAVKLHQLYAALLLHLDLNYVIEIV